LVNEAADCLDAHDGARAKVLSQKAVELYPECAIAWGNLAYAEILLGNFQPAFDAAREAVSLNPTFATGWHNLGEACARMSRWEESLTYNERAVTIDPGNALFYLGKGTALAGLERFGEAIESFDKSLALDPLNESVRMNRESAVIRADPTRTKILCTLLGIGHFLKEGKRDASQIPGTILRLFIDHKDDINVDLVRSFDWFARMNISLAKPDIVNFCLLNCALATLVGDADLRRICEERVAEAQEMMKRHSAK
jgi:tetratricopeptide (TPR) repeat protein